MGQGQNTIKSVAKQPTSRSQEGTRKRVICRKRKSTGLTATEIYRRITRLNDKPTETLLSDEDRQRILSGVLNIK